MLSARLLMFIQLGYTRSCRFEFKLGSQLRKNRDFLLLMYVNERLTKQSVGRKLDCFSKGIQLCIAFAQSHRPEEAIRFLRQVCIRLYRYWQLPSNFSDLISSFMLALIERIMQVENHRVIYSTKRCYLGIAHTEILGTLQGFQF